MIALGREFIVNLHPTSISSDHPAPRNELETRSVVSEDTDDDNGLWSGKATKLHLRAPDAEIRLLWVTMLLKAKQLSLMPAFSLNSSASNLC